MLTTFVEIPERAESMTLVIPAELFENEIELRDLARKIAKIFDVPYWVVGLTDEEFVDNSIDADFIVTCTDVWS